MTVSILTELVTDLQINLLVCDCLGNLSYFILGYILSQLHKGNIFEKRGAVQSVTEEVFKYQSFLLHALFEVEPSEPFRTIYISFVIQNAGVV